jgi:hypothetical protein
METVTREDRDRLLPVVLLPGMPPDGHGHRARLTLAVLSSKTVAIAEKLAGELI